MFCVVPEVRLLRYDSILGEENAMLAVWRFSFINSFVVSGSTGRSVCPLWLGTRSSGYQRVPTRALPRWRRITERQSRSGYARIHVSRKDGCDTCVYGQNVK